MAQTVFPVRPRLLFNDGELPQTGRFEKCRMVPCVAIYTNSRGNTIPRSSNKGSGRNGDQPEDVLAKKSTSLMRKGKFHL
ncbi:MAG: hypothetical protein BA868_05145 [Desulfobacterales bacterium C00003106]|nr:MAG: hypothetical protein BA868_05145 [Desulfobacterales bacterium C00003106]